MTDSGLSLIAYFVVAFVIVSPFAVVVVRRVLRERREQRPQVDPTDAGLPSRRADDLATVFEAIEAGRAGDEHEFEVVVATRPTVDGLPADAAVVDALLIDAITRSGLQIVSDEAGEDGRILTLRRR